ncbi:MAG: hypothetical protein JXA30_13060, partial [Deltaproteobacteria bacterium]|nr:hypothetical protein [Deltaproteobacteria bacterium]
RKTGFRPRAGSSGTASTILAGPAGALGSTGELAADLFAHLNAYKKTGKGRGTGRGRLGCFQVSSSARQHFLRT